MSRGQVYVFVEGRDLDPDVYSRICGPVCKASGKAYEIVIADRIAGGGGGKSVLTKFFEYLRDNGSLVDRSTADAKLAMFYLDKDVDDFFGSMLVSDHVVYTRYYNVENHLFNEGELVSSIATAGSLDVQLIRARIPNPQDWRKRAASHWVDWIALCLLARKLSLPYPVSYAMRCSKFNAPPTATANAAILSASVDDMLKRSGLTKKDFDRKLAASYRLIRAIITQSRHDEVFKGKWYIVFALRELEEVSAGLFNQNGASDRLLGSLIATANFDGHWVEHFRYPLRSALASL